MTTFMGMNKNKNTTKKLWISWQYRVYKVAGLQCEAEKLRQRMTVNNFLTSGDNSAKFWR